MSISEYQKDGKKFYKVYVQMRGKELKRIRVQRKIFGIETLSVAQKEEKRLIKEVTEIVAKMEGNGLLWSEIIYRWEVAAKNGLVSSRLSRDTVNDHVKRLQKYTLSWLNRPASSITRVDGRQVLLGLKAQALSEPLLKKIKTSINLIYTWGYEEGLIKPNAMTSKGPVHGIGIESKDETIKPILTLEEVRSLLYEAKFRQHPWYPIWSFALLTGMRSGELMALEWSDIDEVNGIIRVSKSFNKRMKLTKCPKNGTWRNVDISSQLKEILALLKNVQEGSRFVLPQFPEWKHGQAGTVLRDFLKRIGIEKDVVFHTLRACFATHLLSTGVEPLKVMRMGGWSDLKTFQIYLRLSGVDVRGVAEGLNLLPVTHDSVNVVALFSSK